MRFIRFYFVWGLLAAKEIRLIFLDAWYFTWSSVFAVLASCYNLRLGKRAMRLEGDLLLRSILFKITLSLHVS